MNEDLDCIVVGGGAAGLSAALVLGRARRRTLVVDAGEPSNAVAPGIGGLLGSDGRAPADLYAAGRAELAAYPSVEVRVGEVLSGERRGEGFRLRLADGAVESARRVVLATGMDYRIPDLVGIKEKWGASVFHCPFCHGWENRERPLGVIGRGRAFLLRAWSDDVTLYTQGEADLTDAERGRMASAGIAVEDRAVVALRGPGAALEAVEFADGDTRACRGLLVPYEMRQRSGLASSLGATLAAPGMVAVDSIAVDGSYSTDVPGLYAVGDVGAQMPSIGGAIAGGQAGGSAVVMNLMESVPIGEEVEA